MQKDTVIVHPIIYDTIHDSLCQGGHYSFNGRIITEPDIYTDTLRSSFNCDSIVTLNLSVKNSSTTTENLIICTERLPFDYRDTVFGVGTESGTYIFVNDCEIVTLDLEIVKLPTLKIAAPSVCADESYFTLDIASLSSDYPNFYTEYSIIFDNNALNAGFVNQYGQISDMYINVEMPAATYPDYYNFTLILTHNSVEISCAAQIELRVTVFYPDSIMKQKWDNVIALTNTYYNGGYAYKAYQWYRNGNILVGENHSYLYIGKDNTLNTEDSYTVEITRPDGSKMFSCPFVPHIPIPQISDYPIVVSGNGEIKIYATRQNLKARLWTIDGRLLSTVTLYSPMEAIAIPWQHAVYLVEIFDESESFRQVIPVVVRGN
jgi:hypothetical protein